MDSLAATSVPGAIDSQPSPVSAPPAPQIIQVPDLAGVVEAALKLVLERIETTLAQADRCTLVLAGGSTPKPLYEALAQADLPWDRIHCFWGDERYVSPDHPDSNEGMARRAWLDQVPFPADRIHPMPTGSGDPSQDARAYDRTLGEFFGVGDGEFPAFDVVLLGMGPDGHTASLFPHTEALGVVDRRVTVGNKDGEPRLTLTLPQINQSKCVIFLVTGANKQPALGEIFSPTGDDRQYPARSIRPQGSLYWILDRAAGEVVGAGA